MKRQCKILLDILIWVGVAAGIAWILIISGAILQAAHLETLGYQDTKISYGLCFVKYQHRYVNCDAVLKNLDVPTPKVKP